jgi:hypothetical protein
VNVEALWLWVQGQGPIVAVLAVAVWRLDQHLSAFRADLGGVHQRLLEIVRDAMVGAK